MSSAPAGGLGRQRRVPARVALIAVVIVSLHCAGLGLYLHFRGDAAGAGGLAGAGSLAYVLGVRHAFDADHIAAIDDTTRLMLLRGQRPLGVGFFFAMGHSTVVLGLALVVAYTARGASDHLRATLGVVAASVAVVFLLLVAALNGSALLGLTGMWRRVRAGDLDEGALDAALLNRGLMNRLFAGRARSLIRSSWHMFPLGLLMGLGLETASEITLLSLSAATAVSGGAPFAALVSLPLLFAAGMSTFDTADSLLMAHAYSWAYRQPARMLFYNVATTGVTVLIAVFVATVYLADLLVAHVGLPMLAGYASLADHFEVFGYTIAAVFVATWLAAMGIWRFGGFERRVVATTD